jgi:multiple antibiotic resistance protein|tara:strand:+ start:574 stop:1215 length:642 start_codon:yes stop_codon:yes gene_type:complete
MNELIIETATVAFATFFATIGPADVAAMYAALTSRATPKHRRQMAVRAVLIAGSILIVFALIGDFLLSSLGISLAALRTAGGILLLLIGIDMVFARHSGGTSTTDEEEQEALSKRDISVFPIATPLIAGPGALGAVILLMANAEDDISLQIAVIAALLLVLLITLTMLLLASSLQKLLGVTGMQVISRIFGVLLSALAIQFVFDGIAQSGLLS